MTAPPRILFVNHVGRVSGAERSLLDVLRHLDRGRFEPVAVIPPGGELAEELASCGVPCHRLPLRRLRRTVNPLRPAGVLWNVAQVVVRLARLIRRERIALVHANSNTAQLYGGAAARLCGVPCVWHTRDLVDLGVLGRWLDRTATRTIAISECVRRHVAPCTRDARTLQTIYNGIDAEALVPRGERARVRAELGLPPDAPVVGMVGQLIPWKGHDAFLAMAARVGAARPDARFVIVGADLFGEHASYRRQLEARMKALGITERVLFTGYRPDVARVLEGLDVLVHPATREPLGRVVLEAMALERPVVAVNACGPGEIIRDGEDGLLTATGTPEELAAAVLDVLRDPARAARLGAAARRRVERDFNVRETVRCIEAVYDEALAARGALCA